MMFDKLFATLCAQRAPAAAAGLSILHDGEELHLSSDDGGNVSRATRENSLRLPASCMIKPFTATVIVQVCHEMQLPLDSDVAALLEPTGQFSEWTGITLRQLLNSTHGLDDPLSIAVAYPLVDGYIDLDALYSRLNAAPRLAAPGAMYSYSDAGPLIAAGVMERLLKRRFSDIAADTLLGNLGVSVANQHLCPTLGGEVTVSASDLLRLAQRHVTADTSALAAMRTGIVMYPGWSMYERGAALGWNQYEGGWFGYMALTATGGFLLLRFHPEQRTAIAVVSKSIPATDIVRAVMPDLPEFQIRLPAPLFPNQIAEIGTGGLPGRYERSALAVEVVESDDGLLRFSIFNRDPHRPVLKRPIERVLQLAENYAFFATPTERYFIPHGQFVGGSSQRFEYLWSGRHLWRRTHRN